MIRTVFLLALLGQGGCTAGVGPDDDDYAGSGTPLRYVTASVRSFGHGGGFGRIDVVVPSGEGWSATTSDPWISIISGYGSGSGTVSYSTAPNIGSARLGRIAIAGRTVTVMQQPSPSMAEPFTDMAVWEANATYAYLMRELGLTRGCQGPPAWRYCPNDTATRGQAAVFVVRALQVRSGLAPDGFTAPPAAYFPADVPEGHPYFRHVQKLRELGLTAGCGAGSFCPDQPVTAAMLAIFVARGLYGDGFESPPAPYFTDLPVTHYAFRHAQKLRALGMWDGCGGGGFCPDRPLTRGEVAAMILRAFLDAPRENGQCTPSCAGHACASDDGCGTTCDTGSGCVVASDDGFRAATAANGYMGCFSQGSACSRVAIGATGFYCETHDYVFPSARALDTLLLRDVSIERCIEEGRRNGFPFVGLQQGNECWGGHVHGWAAAAESGCATPCSADPGRTCGGRFNASVYLTHAISPLACTSPHNAFFDDAMNRCDACDFDEEAQVQQNWTYVCGGATFRSKRVAYEEVQRLCRRRTGTDCCAVQYRYLNGLGYPFECRGWYVRGYSYRNRPAAPRGRGTGLRMDVFRDASFGSLAWTDDGASTTSRDRRIHAFFHDEGPGLVSADNFSIRWTGSIEPRFSETYTFHVLSDDGVRLWIDGRLLIDHMTSHALDYDQASVMLTAGRRHDIRVDFVEQTGNAYIQLRWSSASEPNEVVPIAQLHPGPAPCTRSCTSECGGGGDGCGGSCPLRDGASCAGGTGTCSGGSCIPAGGGDAPPRIGAGGIVNAFTYGEIHPGDFISIFGSGFALSGNLVELSGGFGTTFHGSWGAGWYESAGQINLELPGWVGPGTVQARVWDGDEWSPSAAFEVLP